MKLFKILPLLVLSAALAYPQTALTRTTFSAAVTASDECATVASATGITARGLAINTVLYSGRELFRVSTVSGTRVCFAERGSAGSRIHAHASGAQVLLGPPSAFGQRTPVPGSTCTSTDQSYRPLIVPSTGEMFDCDGTNWLYLDNREGLPLGTGGTAVTTYEWGTARHRFIKLVFASVAMVSPGSAVSLAGGYLLYTAPAGIWVVNSASINVSLEEAGATCNADTPDLGLGTVIGTGAVATLDGTGTFEDILTGQTINNLTGTAELKTLSQGLGIELAGAHTVHLNAADGWAGDCDATGDGTVYLELQKLD